MTDLADQPNLPLDTSLLCFLNNVSDQLACFLDLEGTCFKRRLAYCQHQQQTKCKPQLLESSKKIFQNDPPHNHHSASQATDGVQSSIKSRALEEKQIKSIKTNTNCNKIVARNKSSNRKSTRKIDEKLTLSLSNRKTKRGDTQQSKRNRNNNVKHIEFDDANYKATTNDLLLDGLAQQLSNDNNNGHHLSSSITVTTSPSYQHMHQNEQTNNNPLNHCDDLNGAKLFTHQHDSNNLLSSHPSDHHLHEESMSICESEHHQQLTLSLSDEVNLLNAEHSQGHQQQDHLVSHHTHHQSHHHHHSQHSHHQTATSVSISPIESSLTGEVHQQFSSVPAPPVLHSTSRDSNTKTNPSNVSHRSLSGSQREASKNPAESGIDTGADSYYVQHTLYEEFGLPQQHHHQHHHQTDLNHTTSSNPDPSLLNCYPMMQHPQVNGSSHSVTGHHHHNDMNQYDSNMEHTLGHQPSQQHWNGGVDLNAELHHTQNINENSSNLLHHQQPQSQLQFVTFYQNHQGYYNTSVDSAHSQHQLNSGHLNLPQSQQQSHPANHEFANTTSTNHANSDHRIMMNKQHHNRQLEPSQQQNETRSTINDCQDPERNGNQNSDFNHHQQQQQQLDTQGSGEQTLHPIYQHHHQHTHDIEHHHDHPIHHHHDLNLHHHHHHVPNTHLLPLVNGIETSSVILQDINLASATWSASPEDLYSM